MVEANIDNEVVSTVIKADEDVFLPDITNDELIETYDPGEVSTDIQTIDINEDGDVVVATEHNYEFMYYESDGSVKWTNDIGEVAGLVSFTPDGDVIGINGDNIYLMDGDDGSEKWHTTATQQPVTLLPHSNGKIYYTNYDAGKVWELDEDGDNEIFSYNTSDAMWVKDELSNGDFPVVVEEDRTILINTDGDEIGGASGPFATPPAVDEDDNTYVVDQNGELYKFDTNLDTILTEELGDDMEDVAAGNNDLILTISGTNRYYRYTTDGDEIWEKRFEDTVERGLASTLLDDSMYFVVATGSKVFKYKTEPIEKSDTFYQLNFICNNDAVIEIEDEKIKSESSNETEGALEYSAVLRIGTKVKSSEGSTLMSGYRVQ